MEPSAQTVSALREKFFKKLEEEPPNPSFHPADIARIKENDLWLKRFLEHNDLNMQESLKMLLKVCKWRQQFGTNDITLDNVKREYLEDGSFFSYSKDKDGKKLFIFKSKLHFKGTKNVTELQRCVVYWFERLEREGNGDQLSLFFDMAESGLSNVDMDFTQFLINLFKNNYPNFLNYIIIFEMPWIINTAFKVIKSWLPAKAIPKIKFVNKSTLHEYVDPNDALTCWGGKNDYTFKFVPEVTSNYENSTNGKAENRKVHFAEGSPTTEEPSSAIGDHGNDKTLLSIEPKIIMFSTKGNDTTARINLKNLSTERPVTYKIKTTSPKLFRVKPNTAILMPLEQCSVVIALQPGHSVHDLTDVDKFLVTCLPLNSSDVNQDLPALWKTQVPTEQHRLKCASDFNENQEIHSILSGTGVSDRSTNALFAKMTSMEENCNRLHNELKTLKYLVLLSIILTILIAITLVYVLKRDIRDYNENEYCPHAHDL